MTREERRLVRASFEAVREQAGPVALLFYGRLFELEPSARRLFHNDLAMQSKKIMDTLDWVTTSLDDLAAAGPRLAELGRQHAGYGVRPEQYDAVTAALLWALAQAIGPDFDRPIREAWQAALGAVSAAMKEGAAQA